jgi:ATP-dependent helicase HrpB
MTHEPRSDDAAALPVLEVLGELRQALAERGAAVLVAPPGTGKTTGLPPALLEEPWLGEGRIVVVEPRRLAARAAATRMAAVHGSSVGDRFGYAVRGERRTSAATRVEVVTEGLFLRRLQADPTLDGVGAVLLDEFHERSVDLDLALTLLVDVRAALRPDLRLLVMSATLQPGPVAELLGDEHQPAPVVEATAPLFDVATRYRPGSAHDPLEQRVAEVVVEALRTDPGDLLVFLPGRPEIHRVARALERRGVGSSGGAGPEVLVEQLHGSLSPAEQERVVHPDPGGRRRVVLSTSLAETSITVPGVRVVVDAGRRRAVRTDAHTGLPALSTGPVSRAGADQRRGRAGRTDTGVAYRLWAEADDRHRPSDDTPEILDGDLAPLVLQLLAWGVDDPWSLAWLDTPPARSVDQARELLAQLGALDDHGRLTPRGRALAEIGFHPRLASVAVAGRELGRTELAAEVVAVLETSRSGDVDLAERVRELRDGRASGDVEHSLRQWRRTLRARGDRHDRHDRVEPGAQLSSSFDAEVARLLLAGYPDRVARRRSASRTDDRGRARTVFHLRSGGEVAVPERDHGFERADWLVVADLDGGAEARAGRMHLGAAVDEAVVLEVLGGQVETVDSVDWDERRGDVSATRSRRLGAITVDRRPLTDVPRAARQHAIAEAVRREGLSLLARVGQADELRARVALLRAVQAPSGSAQWPDWSAAHLAETADEWLGDRLERARSRSDLARIDVRGALEAQLTWDQTRALDELAPTQWELASGRKVSLRYGEVDGEPATVLASVRLRDLLGTDVHPTVAAGRVPVTVELLSPAGRPVQRTTDLPGFWRGSYAEVRKELRGRYPKHPWPERPWESPPPRAPRR